MSGVVAHHVIFPKMQTLSQIWTISRVVFLNFQSSAFVENSSHTKICNIILCLYDHRVLLFLHEYLREHSKVGRDLEQIRSVHYTPFSAHKILIATTCHRIQNSSWGRWPCPLFRATEWNKFGASQSSAQGSTFGKVGSRGTRVWCVDGALQVACLPELDSSRGSCPQAGMGLWFPFCLCLLVWLTT